MNPSEINDSGKFSGHRSNFSQTCSLLSQYLKEKRSYGDLSLGLSANFQQHGTSSSTPATTKNLLPMIEKTGQNMGDPTRVEPERAPMTIFYRGQVIVFNDVPADKAKEFIGVASKACSQNPNTYATTTMVPKPAESATNLVTPASNVVHGPRNNLVKEPSQMPRQPLAKNDFPIMSNASLSRFFEKRKDRIIARAPYQMRNSVGATSEPVDSKTLGATSRPVESKTWLGLAPQSHQQIERQL